MHCPKCSSAFEHVTTPDGGADRCTGCHGLWFDMLEHERLARHADGMDVGDPVRGASFNDVRKVMCPVCPRSYLVRMVDVGQPHIWFEACPSCFGRFYDAGEVRDVSRSSILDLIKRLRARARD